ncbi:hypothetical protein BD309DRAFT_973360 [Dichomitus squalens]|nr:hypothetical protein BD309DRAFT_973360 [Dichomitus squalens]
MPNETQREPLVSFVPLCNYRTLLCLSRDIDVVTRLRRLSCRDIQKSSGVGVWKPEGKSPRGDAHQRPRQSYCRSPSRPQPNQRRRTRPSYKVLITSAFQPLALTIATSLSFLNLDSSTFWTPPVPPPPPFASICTCTRIHSRSRGCPREGHGHLRSSRHESAMHTFWTLLAEWLLLLVRIVDDVADGPFK